MAVAPRYGPYGSNPTQIEAKETPDNFEILIDAKNFAPEEISVKVNNNLIFIDAEHMERQPGYPVKYIRRKIHRQFNLPPNFDAANIVSGITPDGILSVRCRAHHFVDRHLPLRY